MSYTSAFRRLAGLCAAYPEAPDAIRLNGMLSAVAAGPDLVRHADWLPALFGSDQVDDESTQAAEACLDAMDADLRSGRFEPVLTSRLGQRPQVQAWIRGFEQGVALDRVSWEACNRLSDDANDTFLMVLACGDTEVARLLRLPAAEQRRLTAEAPLHLGPALVRLYNDYRAPELTSHLDATRPYAPPPAELAGLSDDQLLQLLDSEGPLLTRVIVEECLARSDRLLPHLGQFLTSRRFDASDQGDGDPDWPALHALHLLGLAEGEQANTLLVDALRTLDGFPDQDLWDWLFETWPLLFLNKGSAGEQALEAVLADTGLSWMARSSAAEGLAALAARRDAEGLDRRLDGLAALAGDPLQDMETRCMLGSLLLDYPRPRHRALFAELAAQQEPLAVQDRVFGHADIEAAFGDPGDPEAGDPRAQILAFYDPEAVLDRQLDDLAGDESEYGASDDDDPEPPTPLVRGGPKVGRNDPCPCGSGKKYKKCCGG